MKGSIKLKYTFIISLVLVVLLLIVTLFMNFGLGPFVTKSKETAMSDTAGLIEERLSDGWDDEDSSELVRISMEDNYGISLYYVDGDSSYQIFSTNTNLEGIRTRLEFFISSGSVYADEVIEKTDSYILYRIFDSHMASQQIECMGKTENVAYVISTSMTSIRESASISNKLLIYISLLVIVASALIVYFVCTHLTKPISSLAKQSESISRLDFSMRYEGKASDEIGTLGNNMNHMSDQLKETIEKLQNANKKLEADILEKEKINQHQREFIANVSHELKTPIALISGYAEGLKEGVADDPDSASFYTEVIMDEAGRMNTIVKRLLSLDEIESGRLEPVIEEFDLVALVKGVVSSSTLLSSDKDVKIKVSAPDSLSVSADEFMIEQVIQNYFSNACHHVSNPGEISINIIKSGDESVIIEVRNTGRLIPDEDLPRIWDKFFKVDKAHTRSYGGSGIGLSIVKSVAEVHGGRVDVRNTQDGVAFSFELPLKTNN